MGSHGRVGVPRPLRWAVGVLLLVGGLCSVGASGAGVTVARRDGEILSFDGGFWLSGPQGQRPHPLAVPAAVGGTVSFGGPTFPTFSPSGRKLAFLFYSDLQSRPRFSYGVEVTNAHGQAARVLVRGKLLTKFFEMSGLAFSPDGRVLAYGYVYVRHGTANLFATKLVLVNVNTGRVLRSMLLPGDPSGDLSGPFWSADGELLFVSDGSLYAVRPDGTHRRLIKVQFPGGASTAWSIDTVGEARPVAPSPDGSQLAVAATNGSCDVGDVSLPEPVASRASSDCSDVFLVPGRGGRAKRLGQNECCPVWSPNGRQVVFGFAQNQDLITLATGRVKILHIPGGPLAWQALPK